MSRAFTILGVAAVGTVLAGCGSTSSSPQAAIDPAGAVEPNGPPTWGGCREFVQRSIDYAPDAPGAVTPRLAMATYRQDGDHVVLMPHHDHMNRQWLLVDDENVIHTALELWHGEHGWLVGGVEHCSD